MIESRGRKVEDSKPETPEVEAGAKKSRLELMTEFAEKTAPLGKDGRTSTELFDELYHDETGLPK